ncbi:uncharacterized protein LOC127876875 [Dreissena polymorpha]|uniref:Uncharacterized protein n=1 Tax=Dreissena polymorpha TaxID=45954 RepID=A0A9D4KCS0_DREPO|nr:uncharacterized protein LOC127876875 [Dreissena polymorpha]XP_052278335.1 uncharacterized protein LOC127876875 [Dreissena polymorpha]KAH3837019.1 hypothetical protein DPMN_110397 [Dreissena polymorpha]
MKKSGRLGISDVLSSSADAPAASSKPASVTKQEKELQALKFENKKLKGDLNEIRSLYKQLVQENSHERFDERRVTLLKSQIIQLERQILLLNEALSSRGQVLYEVENNLQWIANTCRGYICKDTHGPQVPVERSQLTLMVETAESARIKLYKQLENTTSQQLSQPLKHFSEFLQTQKEGEVSMLEVAMGTLEHLNIKHVTKLETKLSTLYRDLIHLHSTMEADTKNESAYLWTSCHVTKVARERLVTQILTSCARLKDCSSDLLELSLLFPSAPWPPLRKNAIKDVTADRVIQCIPSRSRSQETLKVIEALVKAYNYKVYMLRNESDSLREEVKYHKTIYNLQLKYAESLFQAIREAYGGFEAMTNEVIVKPLKEVLEAYVDLSQSASEEALKVFMRTFKDRVTQFGDIVETLTVKEPESEGATVLSQYGEEFFKVLEKVVKEEQLKRDNEASHVEHLREEQDRLDSQLHQILEEQETRQQLLMMSSNHDDTDEVASGIMPGGDVIMGNTLQGSEFSDSSRNNLCTSLPNNKPLGKSGKLKNKEKPLHKKEWVNIVEDPLVDKETSFVNTLHRKDFVNDTQDYLLEKNMQDLDINDANISNRLSDAELLAYHKNTTYELQMKHQGLSEKLPKIEDASDMSDISQTKTKSKKKLGYVPNTFVPNRTLQLRRSGSQSRLGSLEKSLSSAAESSSLQYENQSALSGDTRSRSHSRDDLAKTTSNNKGQREFKSRPAFR